MSFPESGRVFLIRLLLSITETEKIKLHDPSQNVIQVLGIGTVHVQENAEKDS